VSTTRPMSNSSISSKSQRQIFSGNTSCVIHKRTGQGTTTVFYQLFILSIHGLCYDCVSYPNVHALSSCSITHLPYIYLKASMPYTCALMSYPKPYSSSPFPMCILCVYHEEPCPLISLHL